MWISAFRNCTDLKVGQKHCGRTSVAVGPLASAPCTWARPAPGPALPSLLFSLLQVLLILTALQPSIFSVLANGGQIACSPPFSSKIRSQGEHIKALISFQDEWEGEGQGKVREVKILKQRLGQAGCCSRYSKKDLQESQQRFKETMTFLITQKRAAIPQLEASLDGLGSILSSGERNGCG